MSWLKKVGKTAGDTAGLMLGGSIRVVGELTGVEFVKEIGDGVERATAKTGLVLGHAASGVWDVGTGLVTRSEKKVDAGVDDIGRVLVSTVKGLSNGIGYICDSSADVVQGIREKDKERLKHGAKNLTKAAAIGALAIGVFELVDGLDGADGSSIEAEVPEQSSVSELV